MINNELIRLKRDTYQWVLEIARQGRDKDGNAKTQWDTSYHATLEQVASNIARDLAVDVKELDQLIKVYDEFLFNLTQLLEAQQ